MRVAVIGLGLIGGSLVRALAERGHDVRGHDLDPSTRAVARTAAALAAPAARWHVSASLHDAVRDVDLVVIAVPLPAVSGVVDDLAAATGSGLITDVTSVKVAVHQILAERWRRDGARLTGYVGGHPMAGRAESGFAAGDAALFDGCAWALCFEPQETSIDDWLRMAALVTSLGARAVPTTAADHDAAVARVSHVPHLVAAALARLAADDPLALTLGAGSFRDSTRVATTRPALSAAMCGGNPEPVAEALQAVLALLGTAGAALDTPDPIAELTSYFAPAAVARRAWPPRAGAPVTMPPDPQVLLGLGRAGGWVTSVAADLRSVAAVLPAG